MKNVYVLRNRKIAAFLDPFYDEREKGAVKTSIARYCILNLDEAKKQHYDEAEFYFLGTYDDEHAKFELLEQPEFVCGFDDVFLNKSN